MNNSIDINQVYTKHISSILCDEVKKYGDPYLKSVFKEFIEKIVFTESLCNKFFTHSSSSSITNARIKEQIIKIKTFTLHYLSRGALIPIRSTSENGHRSPLDYIPFDISNN